MFYQLSPELQLRGWDLLETGIIDSRTNRAMFTQPQVYRLIQLCNGKINSESVLFTDAQRDLMARLADDGILTASTVPLPPLTEKQAYRRYHNRLIASAHWSITGHCNYRCRHCYMNAPHGKLPQLSREQWTHIVHEMADCGVLRVSLTGGEALVHPDFWSIVDLLIENGIQLETVYSNGFRINEAFFQGCEARGIRPGISLSFDGTDGTHEWLRNTPGAQQHIDNALRLCREHGFPVDVEFCLHRGNRHTLRSSMQYLEAMGCTSVKLNRLDCIGEGAALGSYALTLDEYYQTFMEYVPQYKQDGVTMPIMGCRVLLQPDGIDLISCHDLTAADAARYCLCGHARNSMYITCEGHILPCIPYSESEAALKDFSSVFDLPLREILTNSRYFSIITMTLSEYLEKNPRCAACPHRYACAGGCRGRAVLRNAETADHFGIDDEMCWFFHNGMDDKFRSLSQTVFE